MPLIAMTREMGSLGKDVAAGDRRARRQARSSTTRSSSRSPTRCGCARATWSASSTASAGIWERLTTDRTSLSIFTADETFRFLRDDSTGVIRGWGAVHLLKNIPHVIRVRICAPLETRMRRMMERLATDNRDTVENEIQLSEEAHTAITKRHFGVNWRDPEHYDLVLCTERLSVDECVDEIEGMMKQQVLPGDPGFAPHGREPGARVERALGAAARRAHRATRASPSNAPTASRACRASWTRRRGARRGRGRRGRRGREGGRQPAQGRQLARARDFDARGEWEHGSS